MKKHIRHLSLSKADLADNVTAITALMDSIFAFVLDLIAVKGKPEDQEPTV